AFAAADNSVALGALSDAMRANVVSVGSAERGITRQITNVAAGTEGTDAVNLDQLNAVADAAGQTGRHFQAEGAGVATVDGVRTVAAGDGAVASQANAVALGAHSLASGLSGTATGYRAQATGTRSTATGAKSLASGLNATATGFGSRATGVASTAIGYGAYASGNNSIAIGVLSEADRADSLSVGSAGAERQIVHVAAGTAPTDAANMGQLGAAAAALGGGAGFSGGAFTAPTYVIQGGSYSDVGSALSALDAKVTEIDGRVGSLEGAAATTAPGTSASAAQVDDRLAGGDAATGPSRDAGTVRTPAPAGGTGPVTGGQSAPVAQAPVP